MSQTAIALQGLTIGYRPAKQPEHRICTDLDLSVKRGEFTVLLGPNGAGKSTLLRTVCGLQEPLAGRVLLEGEAIHDLPPRERARRLGVVLTERVDTWGLRVWDLVALGRAPHTRWSGTLSEADRAAIVDALEVTDTFAFAARQVSELSDGERQRVMVARALAQEPVALVLDEVTAFLDLPRRTEMMTLLRSLAHREDKALLLSTHDLDLALRTADRLWMIDRTGAMFEGCPEDLVLAGTLAGVFQHEGLDYDIETGRFRMESPRGVRLRLVASGIEGRWTRHALERCGFEIATSEAAQGTVSVDHEDGATRWRFESGELAETCNNLAQLTRVLDTCFTASASAAASSPSVSSGSGSSGAVSSASVSSAAEPPA